MTTASKVNRNPVQRGALLKSIRDQLVAHDAVSEQEKEANWQVYMNKINDDLREELRSMVVLVGQEVFLRTEKDRESAETFGARYDTTLATIVAVNNEDPDPLAWTVTLRFSEEFRSSDFVCKPKTEWPLDMVLLEPHKLGWTAVTWTLGRKINR